MRASVTAGAPGLFDFKSYPEASSVRFYRAYRQIRASGESLSVCDVGGFWGVLPLTLKELGYTGRP
ncbi:MAG TPA: hypothetical protein VF717_19200 [Pyrinomonadaceae bacterium]